MTRSLETGVAVLLTEMESRGHVPSPGQSMGGMGGVMPQADL